MIRIYLHAQGEVWEGRDEIFDISPLGIYHIDRNEDDIKTGEWTLLPWNAIREVQRIKDPAGMSPLDYGIKKTTPTVVQEDDGGGLGR